MAIDPKYHEFYHYLQLHNRAWGNTKYRNRRSTSEIIRAACVVFWWPTKKGEERFYITIHEDTNDLAKYCGELWLKAAVRGNMDRHIFRVFYRKRRVFLHGIKLLISYEENGL